MTRDVDTKPLGDGWQAALPPPEEAARLKELYRYHILDSWATPGFDNITSLVSRLLDVKIALVSLLDQDRQWFKSVCGIDDQETPRDYSFCSYAIWNPEPFIVLDTHADDRFKGNPLVTGEPHIRFYAGAPLISPNGYHLGSLCAIDDKPREELREKDVFTLQQLAELVVDEMQLHLSNIELEELSNTKTNFLATMSHEIRTPMNGIIGMASMLKKSELNEKQHRFVDIITKSADALLEIINDILDLSKIEAGKMTLEAVPIDMIQVARDAMDVVSTAADEKELALKIIYDPAMPAMALGDPVRIRQILLNLLSNAIKFTDGGEITLEVKCLDKERDGKRRFSLAVSDTGIGIRKEKQQVIFNMFDQEDMSTTRKFGGTGLGLAICQNLCHLMHGSIEVESESGEGSTFTVIVTLDIDPEHADDVHPEETGETMYSVQHAEHYQLAAELPNLDGEVILLVEDNPVNREVMHEMLAGCKAEIVIARNGLEAVEKAKKQDFSIVLMDCTMPEMDGYEATGHIRETKGNDLPIIALTARAMQGDKEKCLAAGMDDYLSKPITQEQLFAALDKWLHQRVAA